jgi:hypothetical protein
MGANCSGKTTVLHALACAFSPSTADEIGYKFPQFFTPNSDSLWAGSDFEVQHSYRQKEIEFNSVITRYTKAHDRWNPKYDRRPIRTVRYLSIRESVPEIESLNKSAMVHYTKASLIDDVSNEIRQAAGEILNRSYDLLHTVKYQSRGRETIGVTVGPLSYAALSMSSGEQRVFRILRTVFTAPKYALILIDEIDLFLHQDALASLLDKLFHTLRGHS